MTRVSLLGPQTPAIMAALIAVAGHLSAQQAGTGRKAGPPQAPLAQGRPFTWSQRLASGSTLAIRNGDGFIRVSESGSDRVEIRAAKVQQTRVARDVAFDVDESNGRTTVCTLYDEQRSCRDRNRSSRRPSVRVEYTVLVPRDIRLELSTGSGEITVERAGSGVTATTGNGRVFIATARGPVSVSTGNGDVDVRVQTLSSAADVGVTTGSGSIRVDMPSDFGGSIDAQSGNGALRTEFDITIVGRLEPRHIRGTIGRGNSTIRLLTGNGRIELRKY